MTSPATTEVDAIVVGGGLAGLAAANRLAEAGRSVILLEKRPRPGGSSALSGGWFALAATPLQRAQGVHDSAELFVSDMVATGGGYARHDLLRRLAERQPVAVDVIGRARAWTDELKISAGMTVARAHLVRIGRLMDFLEREARASGADIRCADAGERLIWDGSRVVGVGTATGALTAWSGVVLTTGGFSRSPELLELFVPDQARAMPYGGVGNTGDGLRMAWGLGAGLADIGHVAGTYGQHAETSDEEHELLTANYLGAILVNSQGQRFTDESESYKILGPAVLAQPGGVAHQVFDAGVRARSRPGVPLSDMERIDELGHLISAPTVAELESTLQISAGALQRTVEQYNESVSRPGSDAWGRTGLVGGAGDLVPLQTPPYFAYSAVTAMTSTYGGLSVAPDAAVQRVTGGPIDGLYAAGELAGGFHGNSYMTGTALTKALIFGVEAADSIIRDSAGASAGESHSAGDSDDASTHP